MRNFKQLAVWMDVAPLLKRLAEKPQLWEDSLRSRYPGSAHAAAQTIFLRWPADRSLEAGFRDLEAEDTPAAHELLPEVARLTNEIYDRVGLVEDTGRAMITRLPAGGEIQAHIDEGPYADLYDRFHLCLAGGPGNRFHCGGEIFSPAPGDAFWFNRKLEHSVAAGSAERIHLILDLEAPRYRGLRGTYFQEEMITDLWPELTPLLEEHWREVAHYLDIELDPDKETYAQFQAMGMLHCYTARDGGELVGYVFFFVRPNMHYRGSIQALQDVLFMLPARRRGFTGVRLIRFAERRLKAMGVQVVYHHAKRTNRVGELLERLGYELVDGIYAKRLDR